MGCRPALLIVGMLSTPTFAHAQLALVPQGNNVWSRGLQACEVVWTDDQTPMPGALQYDLVYDLDKLRIVRTDRGSRPLIPSLSGPRDIDARMDEIESGRTRVLAAPPLSTSPTLHKIHVDVLASGGEDVTISIENLTVIGSGVADFPVLAASFPAAQFSIAQDTAPLSQALPIGGIALREGSFLTFSPRADKASSGLSGRLAFSVEPGILLPVTLSYTGVTDVAPRVEWNPGGESDVLSILFTSSLTPTTGGYPLPIARFQVIGSGPSNTTLAISTSELHAGAPGFQSIADSTLHVPLAILPAQSALVRLEGPTSPNWVVGQQVELVASIDIPAGSTPGLIRAVLETEPSHLRIDTIELVEGAPWFAELITTPPAEVTATGRATVVTMLDTQGEGAAAEPSIGGMVPVFRVHATVLDPEADAAISFALSDATERSPWGEDLVLQPGPPSAWSLIPPPAAILDLFSVH
jgi:hypothetical protein